MSEKIFQAQVNYGWGLSLNMTGKAPAVAKRIFDTYADALAYVNDYKDSAIEGLQLTVVADDDSKKNGVYFVEKIGTEKTTTDESGKTVGTGVANNDGILKKVGGTETETADNYTAAVALSNNLTVGQLIRVTNEEEVDASGDSEDSDITKITYKAGFYIVNAPGSISALDTSTGASDEIGALSNRVASLEGNRVLTSTFDTYKSETATALAAKVESSAFDTYKGEVSTAIGEVSTALDTYKGEVSTALDGKVSNDTLDTYKGEVSTALDGKASTDALNTLEEKVDTDIQNLTNLVSDYSGTLGDVDDRLIELEEFVDSHVYHEFIPISDIEGLFETQTEE